MDNLWLVYLLAVMPNLGSALFGIGLAGLILSVVLLITVSLSDYAYAELVMKSLKLLVPCGIIMVVLGSLCPSQKDIVQSYLMIEGAKVITAENAEKASEVFIERIDLIIDRFGIDIGTLKKDTKSDDNEKKE